MKAIHPLFATCMIFVCVGCLGDGRKERKGTLGGGVGGSMIARASGASTVGIIGGALAGRMVGGSIGKSLDQKDQELAMKAAEQCFQAGVGQTSTWRNPDTGHSGSVTTTREFENDIGERCREYRETVRLGDDQQETVMGIARRGDDGVWRE